MTYNVRNIAIAVIMAIAAAAVVLVYTTSYRQSVTKGQKRVDVLVATRDIPAGTPAEEAAAAMALTSVLSDDKAPGAIATAAGLEGKIASQTIFAGQQVVSAVFGTSTTQAAQLQLTKTERALKVRCNPEASCLIGEIKAGDTVDVFSTVRIKVGTTGDEKLVSRLLLSGVKVLQVPEVDPKTGGLAKKAEKDDATVMLVVDQSKAAKFAFLEGQSDDRGGQIWFAVRPPDAVVQDGPIVSETIESMLLDGLSESEAAKLVAALQGQGEINGGAPSGSTGSNAGSGANPEEAP